MKLLERFYFSDAFDILLICVAWLLLFAIMCALIFVPIMLVRFIQGYL